MCRRCISSVPQAERKCIAGGMLIGCRTSWSFRRAIYVASIIYESHEWNGSKISECEGNDSEIHYECPKNFLQICWHRSNRGNWGNTGIQVFWGSSREITRDFRRFPKLVSPNVPRLVWNQVGIGRRERVWTRGETPSLANGRHWLLNPEVSGKNRPQSRPIKKENNGKKPVAD